MPAAVKARLDARTDRQTEAGRADREKQRERDALSTQVSLTGRHTHEELGRHFFFLKFTQDLKTESKQRERERKRERSFLEVFRSACLVTE